MPYKRLKKEDVDFPVTSEYSKDMIARVQSELLSMCRIVCEILETHRIPYFIAYGTLIGAIKFEGFLPWDDDIDLFLFDETYDEAIVLLENQIPKHLIVHSEKNDKNYFLAWNSVKNTNIEVVANDIYNPDNKLLAFRCLGIDLYRLKRINLCHEEKYKKDEARKFFQKKLNCGMITQEFFEDSLKKLDEKYGFEIEGGQNDANHEEVYTFVVKLNSPLLSSSIFPLKKYKFENLELYGPNNPVKVLSSSFDNIELLPSFEERKTHLKKVMFKDSMND